MRLPSSSLGFIRARIFSAADGEEIVAPTKNDPLSGLAGSGKNLLVQRAADEYSSVERKLGRKNISVDSAFT